MLRLLPQPGGFEGSFPVGVKDQVDDLAVAKGPNGDGRGWDRTSDLSRVRGALSR